MHVPSIKPPQVPAIQANMENQTKCGSSSSSVVSQFFRDEQSRTRVVNGEIASIHDPVSGQSFTLNPAKKLAIPGLPKLPGLNIPGMPKIPGMPQMPAAPQIPDMPKAPGAPAIPGLEPPQVKEIANLGEKMIGGIKVSGKQLSIPVPGKPQALSGEIWTSNDLKLPIHSQITDPSTGCVMTTTFKDVQSGVKVDPKMFQVPADFKIAPPPMAAEPKITLPK